MDEERPEYDESIDRLPDYSSYEQQINNPLTKFALSSLIYYLDIYKKGFTSRTRLNKACYLLNRDLIKYRRIDLKIPWHWYNFGPMIGTSLNQLQELGIAEIVKGANRTTIFHCGDVSKYDVPANMRSAILEQIKKITIMKTDAMVKEAYLDYPWPCCKITVTGLARSLPADAG